MLLSTLVKFYHILLGPYVFADILDFKNLQEKIVVYQINTIIHFSALLSAIGEHNTPLAMRVNIEGLHNILELSRQYQVKLFVPSTIGESIISETKVNTNYWQLMFKGQVGRKSSSI